ncbi:carbohydrate porin [Shewanella sp.]|uniref:carbohydrate porin n=1 Tax=Shewanella sp. TaxID=50422 RepID=UPI003F3B64B3
MQKFKKLSTVLAIAAVTVLAPSFAYANNDAVALEKRLQDLEAKLDAAMKHNDQQPLMGDAVSNIIKPIEFSGYARYGARYQGRDEVEVGSYGALNGNATGRLGNEGNGGEFQLTRTFKNESGAVWDLGFMIEDWNGESIGVKKMYASVTNLFDSQPDMAVWAGRDFHQRIQTGLNDYYWMTHDGQGAGFKNMALGGLKLDMGAVAQADGLKDKGHYAITSKLHGIKLGDVDLNLYANYGDTSKAITDENKAKIADHAYQVAGEAVLAGQKFVVRYANNAKDSVFDLVKDQQALLVSLDGGIPLSEKVNIEYLTAFQKLQTADNQDRANYNIIVRPTYQWNNAHSTWLEMGYNVVDYSEFEAINKSWKATLSQNIAIEGFPGARPMLRFYTTVGNADNEFVMVHNEELGKDVRIATDKDTVTVGAMFEAWW